MNILDDTAFIQQVRTIADRLKITDYRWLLSVMHFETGGTFDPGIRNESSQATGLIQFLPSTARGLGTTVEALATMTRLKQLEFVEKYLAETIRARGLLRTSTDVIASIFHPVAVGHGPDYVVGSSGSKAYEWNKGLDKYPSDGQVKIGEYGVMLDKNLRQRYGVRMDQVETYLARVGSANTLADLIKISMDVMQDSPKNAGLAEIMARTITTYGKIAADFPKGVQTTLDEIKKKDDVDYRTLATNRIRVAFNRPTSFTPTLQDYVDTAKDTAVQIAEKTSETVSQIGGVLPIAIGIGIIAVIMSRGSRK